MNKPGKSLDTEQMNDSTNNDDDSSPWANPVIYDANAYAALTTGTSTLAPAPSLVSTSSFKVNLVWDSTVTSSTFQNAISSAASLISNYLSDNLTINIGISSTGTGGGAYAGPTSGYYETYNWVYSHLKSADPTFNYLPSGTSVQGQSNVAVWNAQLKLWGLSPASVLDGNATFATDISSSALFGVALHELTHAIGRVPFGSAPDVFDLFRFIAPGMMLFSSAIPAKLAYFSIDGGVTNLAYYGTSSDPSDFYNGTPSGKLHSVYSTTYDAFSEFYIPGASNQYLSALDLHSLVAIGFHLAPLQVVASNSQFTTTPVTVSDTGVNIQANLDWLNTNINSIYSIAQTDSSSLNISAKQSVNDSSILMLLNLYEKLSLTISGTTGSETIYGIGSGVINGGGGIDNISLLCHTSSTVETVCASSAVSATNLAKISGFLPTDNISLTNSTDSLNGITNLQTGALIVPGTASVQTVIQTITAGKPTVVSTSGADVLDITGKTYSNISSVIADLSSNKKGSTYITFGADIATGKHILVEYNAVDGVHVAEITQGATSNHLATTSTGVDLIDLVGITTHIAPGHLMIA